VKFVKGNADVELEMKNTKINGVGNLDQRILFEALVKSGSDSEAASLAGVSSRVIECVLKSAKISLAANDGDIDDFLKMIDQFDVTQQSVFTFDESSSSSMEEGLVNAGDGRARAASARKDILDQMGPEWSPEDLRGLGASLLRLADSIDQNWSSGQVSSRFCWPSKAAAIERNAFLLAQKASKLLALIKRREEFIPAELFGEPAWSMLLELFCQFAGGAQVSSKSLCIASGSPQTTALRAIDRLEQAGLVERSTSPNDGRVTLVSLTKEGVIAVGRFLESVPD
ncbi:MAG: MarR family transcriptional regulator, partial [Litorimonas sp.]